MLFSFHVPAMYYFQDYYILSHINGFIVTCGINLKLYPFMHFDKYKH